MLDRTEALYHLGEANRIRSVIQNNVKNLTLNVKNAKKAVEEAKQYLADQQTRLADQIEQLKNVENTIKTLSSAVKDLLDEVEAVQVLKDSRQYLSGDIYTLPDKVSCEQLVKALYTLNIQYSQEVNLQVEVFSGQGEGIDVPDVYKEFVYGVTA